MLFRSQLSYIQYLSSVELVETFCVKDFSLFRERIKQTIQRVFPNVEICFKTCYTVSKAKHPQFLQSLQELQDELNYKLLR